MIAGMMCVEDTQVHWRLDLPTALMQVRVCDGATGEEVEYTCSPNQLAAQMALAVASDPDEGPLGALYELAEAGLPARATGALRMFP